jgi:aminoglycoside phosphotransferase family enzyme/predicted kinase
MGGPWADVVETHTAALYFAGDRVYKVKKPIRLDFLDLTSRDARRRACEAEVTLNSRLTPDVYLGVANIGLPDEPAESAVVMRRLPADASLADRLEVDDSESLRRSLCALAEMLAAFHGRCQTVGRELPLDAWAPPLELWRTELARASRLRDSRLPAAQLQRARMLAERYADGRSQLFAQRLAAGLVRDGHGDLLATDIYLLPDGPRVLDCLEFDDRLRVCDVLHDVAFLAMDLDHRGRPDLATVLLDRYSTAAAETHPATLAEFFIAHRALIRAKVEIIRSRQRREADVHGARLLRSCLRHLERAQVRIVLIGGLPGAGKSTLAAAVAAQLPARLLSSDQIRYAIAGNLRSVGEFDAGRYAPAVSTRVYRELLARAKDALEQGEHVVLDASWRTAEHRRLARRLADQTGTVAVELIAQVDEAVANHRLARRRPTPGGSEATASTRRQMRIRFDAWPEARIVTTDAGLDDSVDTAVRAFNAAAQQDTPVDGSVGAITGGLQ